MSHNFELHRSIYSSIHDSIQTKALLELVSDFQHEPLLKKEAKPSKLPTCNLFLAVCAVGIGGTFQYGYNMSVINAPTNHIQNFINETWDGHYQSKLDENTLTLVWSVIVSIFMLGGLVGALVGGSLAIKLGRKGALLANNFFALLASLFMGIAYPTGRFEFLIGGRFLIGLNTGIGLCVQPLYIGEIAPKHLRGALSLGNSVFLTGGILTGQIIGLREFLGEEKYWPFLVSTCAIPAIAQLLMLPWFPESPRHLLIDRSEEMKCIKALKTFHGVLHYPNELEDIKRENFVLNGEKPKNVCEILTDRTIKWQLIVVVITTAVQQLCGVNTIYFYTDYVFRQAGIPDRNIPYVTVGSGACECVTALLCSLLIEYAGRRILLIAGYGLMAIWCIVLTITLTFQEVSALVPYMSLMGVFAFILHFGLGPGGVTNTLNAELFTQSARPAALTIGGIVKWISLFTIGIIFPFLMKALKQYCFLAFFTVCFLAAAFIFFIVPETENKSFLEIQENFNILNGNRQILATEENDEKMFENGM